ncbi:MAG TPA: hypothetical protein DEA08_31715 [Planctomycetes bacterium]|nr:hypothetical protein [Planctomycetota bacterium]
MKLSATIFRHRSTVLLLLVAPVLWSTISERPATFEERVVGGALLLAGALLRLAAARCLGRGARVHRAGVRGALVTWGPFSFSRNPLYVAAALILAGCGLFSGLSWWGLLLLPGAFLVYTPVVLHEEAAIAEQAGEDYAVYKARVSRWVGLPRNGPEAEGAERSPWGKVLKREKGLIPGLVAAALGIEAARRGLLPLRAWLSHIPAPPEASALALLGLGAVINSIGLLRKQRKHEARRAAQAEQAEQAEGQGAVAGTNS